MLSFVFGMDVMILRENAFSSDDAVVLTTHERLAYFSAAFQGEVDARFNPKKDPPLDDLLHNVIVAGGRTVVIDEDYFISCEDMVHGLERFIDGEAESDRLDIIVACSRRVVGDRLLAFLVMYCGIYNIVFDKQGAELTQSLEDLLKRKRSRFDARELVEPYCWSSFWKKEKRTEFTDAECQRVPLARTAPIEVRDDCQEQKPQKVVFDVGEAREICIQFEIRTIEKN